MGCYTHYLDSLLRDVSATPIGLIFKGRPIGCPETSVTNHYSTLRDVAGERRRYLHSAGSHALMGHRINEGLRHFPRNMTSKRRFPANRGLIIFSISLSLARYSSEILMQFIYIYIILQFYNFTL